MIHVHTLDGCAPAPLAHYLKALGVLRAVATQKDAGGDANARGFWRGDTFCLATKLERDQLVDFFARHYAPAPITAPWNKGAGFFAAEDAGLTPIERSTAARFAPLRAAIAEARKLVGDIAEADAAERRIKEETKQKGLSRAAREKLRADPAYKRRLAEAARVFKAKKDGLIPRCRLEWRGVQARWMAAAVVLAEDGKRELKPVFPSLLGTGGNDGRLDFTNNYYQRLAGLFDPNTGAPLRGTEDRIRTALFGDTERVLLAGAATGQFLPGTAGGANGANGPMANSFVNPMDFVLALEGALFFAANAARRLDVQQSATHASAPFSSRSAASGYGSAGVTDEGPRGEQWMPLWERPSSLAEIERLFAEGRARVGGRAVADAVDFASAIARLGTARGVRAFERFGYIERNGQSNLAVPLGRFTVPNNADPKLGLVDDLAAWMARLRRAARNEHAPARLQHAERRLSDAIFAALQHPAEPGRWLRVLLALADIDVLQAAGTGLQAGPVPPLSSRWATAIDDGSPEIRLALAFALQGGTTMTALGQQVWGDPIRRHALALDDRGRSFAVSGEGDGRLERRPEVVMHGQCAVDDPIALVERRLIEGAQRGERHLPLRAMSGFDTYLPDLSALVAGDVDLDRVVTIGRALLALDTRDRAKRVELREGAGPVMRPTRQARGRLPHDAWTVLRLSTLPWPIDDTCDIGVDPAVFRRLSAGDARGAFRIAHRRLAAAGVRVTVSAIYLDENQAKRWAAAFAFPLARTTARDLLRRIDARTIAPKGPTT